MILQRYLQRLVRTSKGNIDMAFGGKRKGFNVSDHLNRKSSEFIHAKLDRLSKNATTNNIKVGNICLGILKSRGERIG